MQFVGSRAWTGGNLGRYLEVYPGENCRASVLLFQVRSWELEQKFAHFGGLALWLNCSSGEPEVEVGYSAHLPESEMAHEYPICEKSMIESLVS